MESPRDFVAKIYEAVESRNVELSVMLSMRLARLLNDHLNSLIFMNHLHKRGKHGFRYLHRDMESLPKELKEFLWKRSLDVWLETHSISVQLAEDDYEGHNESEKKNILDITAAEIPDERQRWKTVLSEMVCPPGMTPYDTAAFFDSMNHEKARIRLRLNALSEVQSKILALCYTYASNIERQIYQQETTNDFVSATYQTVNAFFKAKSLEVYSKLIKASELAHSNDKENFSLSLTEVRRAIKSVADYLLPPIKGITKCIDGKERDLGEASYLNRLQEFLFREFSKSTSRELLEAELENLSVYVRRIDNIASKGVHTDVTQEEAKQGLVCLYFFLYNIIIKKNAADAQPSE